MNSAATILTPEPNHRHLKPSLSPSSSSSAAKLPIKRKSPSDSLIPTLDPDAIPISTVNFTPRKPPPSKFHRIWTEPDEIRLLQCLLDSSSDLTTFYNRFANTTLFPFSRPQLSQKLRRLRRKFRLFSSRLSHGLNPSQLSPHDRTLFDLSKNLWSPHVNCSVKSDSKFNTKSESVNVEYAERINLVGVRVNFSPTIPDLNNGFGPLDLDEMDDVDAEKKSGSECVVLEKNVVVRSVLNVFDECLKEARMAVEKERLRHNSELEFEKKWKEQEAAEMDVFAKRLRLVLEHSVNRPSVS
ncbi:probable transcription factor At5g28040 [Mercurialis annua]|uniref:probable transcription factor At5g28040 n=1 Tax=Mercurialis annua TaxID=3986 RepID=UPI00215FC7E6|nr:probable transcription factor At5g28040 [Mercurialis annua]XP_050227049.1 probable transcription factor At5g28040 [Mercurialis annua]